MLSVNGFLGTDKSNKWETMIKKELLRVLFALFESVREADMLIKQM